MFPALALRQIREGYEKLALKVSAFLSVCSGNLTFSTCYKPNFLFEQRAFFIVVVVETCYCFP